MTRTLLICLFSAILIAMVGMSIYASLDRSILEVGSALTSDPWFQITLMDAYFGFLIFFCWVAYSEVTWWKRITWFVFIMALGNMATAAYMLMRLWQWNPESGVATLLLRSETATLESHGS